MPISLGTINTTERYIRNGAGVSNTHVATLYRNDVVTIDRDQLVGGFKWYHITDARRGGVNGQKVITLGGLNVDQRTDCWIYGDAAVVLTPIDPPGPTPEPSGLPAYFTAHDEEGRELGKYIKQ